MATYDWISELGLKPIKSKVGKFDEIRHMNVSELKAFTRQPDNKAADNRVVKNVRRASERDRLISSQLVYARNRLRLTS
jgi:hypothetical protein